MVGLWPSVPVTTAAENPESDNPQYLCMVYPVYWDAVRPMPCSDPSDSEVLRGCVNSPVLTGPSGVRFGKFGPLLIWNLGRTQRFTSSKVRNSGLSVRQFTLEGVSTGRVKEWRLRGRATPTSHAVVLRRHAGATSPRPARTPLSAPSAGACRHRGLRR